MANILFLILGIIQIAIAFVGTRQVRRHFSWYTVLILIVVSGLAYDNVAIAAGSLFGEGDVTRAINWPRYAIHALFTPTMMIAAFGMLRYAGVGWAQSRVIHTIVCAVATMLIVLGSYVDVLNLQLVPELNDGVLRYVNDFEFLKGPPIPAVLTIVVVLIFGGFLWRQIKWPWLLVGAVVMFLTASATGFLIVQNLGEVAFAAGLVFTIKRVTSVPASQSKLATAQP